MKNIHRLVCLLTFGWLVAHHTIAQDFQTYLSKHATAYQPGQPGSYSVFDSAFYQNDVFLLGEVHGYAAPQTIDLDLLKHLNQRVGLRYYLAEMDFAQATLVNDYLQTGDTTRLDSLFRGFRRQTIAGTSQWGNQEFYAKLLAIRAYNQTRPDNLRIRFLGVDWFQPRATIARSLLKHILQTKTKSITGLPLLDSLRLVVLADSFNLLKAQPFTKRIRADMAANKAIYQQLLGDQRLPFQFFFELLNCADDKLTRDEVALRMTQCMVDEMGLQREKLYGLWGYTHILQAGTGKQPTLSGLLTKSGRRVVTMATFFKDSDMLIHCKHLPFFLRTGKGPFCHTKSLNADGKVFKIDKFDDVETLSAANSLTLFRLDAPDSPYRQTLRLIKVGGLTGTKIAPYELAPTVTTDYFQYVFVVRDSPPVTVWGN
ncbi:hypothetical protein FAES_4073 [Fibrella aestuarina BUZ 2]|uniref:Erythromycin esterase n=1 Tax=Fibrella aestuarina BUZ 2 TaxID=1166018 RepID=I0KD70_9BACT|nr:erythromycin esterase family protein [Fibrella aestuarina]CCH02073.1 hypothetical protein FAES_4073 [Fibrella aestuarina BUZ 2]